MKEKVGGVDKRLIVPVKEWGGKVYTDVRQGEGSWNGKERERETGIKNSPYRRTSTIRSVGAIYSNIHEVTATQVVFLPYEENNRRTNHSKSFQSPAKKLKAPERFRCCLTLMEAFQRSVLAEIFNKIPHPSLFLPDSPFPTRFQWIGIEEN